MMRDQVNHGNNASEEILDLLDGYLSSAVLITAIEHGLFWELAKRPMALDEIRKKLDVPEGRCQYWLQYLRRLGLIRLEKDQYELTKKAESGIIGAYSQNTWGLLAQETRERIPPMQFLSPNLGYRGSLWHFTGVQPPDYLVQMEHDPERARRFTYMLYEIHQDLARQFAATLELSGKTRLMDLGGGSGVMTIELLKVNPTLSAVIVDIPNVCEVGLEIVEQAGMKDRVNFIPANFMQDDLPQGFDLVLECDVGGYNEQLATKVRTSLKAGGRYIILDQFAPSPGLAPEARLSWAVQGSLRDPEFRFMTAAQVAGILENAGFSNISVDRFLLGGSMDCRFTDEMSMIQGWA